MEGDVGGELGIGPGILELVAERCERLQELFAVGDAVGGDGGAHVVKGVEGGEVREGKLVKEKAPGQAREAGEHGGEGALFKVEGTGGEEDVALGGLGEVCGEGEGGVWVLAEDLPAGGYYCRDVVDGPADVGRQDVEGAVPVVAEGEVAAEVEDGVGLLGKQAGEPEEDGVLAGEHGAGGAQEGGGFGVVVADGAVFGDLGEGFGEGGVDAGEEAFPRVELLEVAVILGSVPDAQGRERGFEALGGGEDAGGLSERFCEAAQHWQSGV